MDDELRIRAHNLSYNEEAVQRLWALLEKYKLEEEDMFISGLLDIIQDLIKGGE